jgi:hypothetical protein
MLGRLRIREYLLKVTDPSLRWQPHCNLNACALVKIDLALASFPHRRSIKERESNHC